MNLSYYNFLSKIKSGDGILYNSRTGCMAKLDKAHLEMLEDFSSQGKEITDLDFAQQLKSCGFLVDDDVSELDLIRYCLLQARFSGNQLSLVIAPTQDCNFRCIYCYEKENLGCGSMSKKTQDSILKFVEQRANQLSALNIEWYGGEPLMELDTIQHMSSYFLDLCSRHHIAYSSDIVTNGYLLNEDAIHILNKCQVSKIQITLDGSRESHDKRRKMQDGSPTFDTIIKNLSLCKQLYSGEIYLRMNVDRENLGEIDKLKVLLKEAGLDQSVTLYLGNVTNVNGTCKESSCLHTYEYAQRNLEFMLEQDGSSHLFRANYPSPLANHCIADCNCGLVIAPDGLIYKCQAEIGCKDRAIGNIQDEHFISNPTVLHQYLLFDPTQDPMCSKCKYLPICLGGCPKERISGSRICSAKRYYLDAYMQHYSKMIE